MASVSGRHKEDVLEEWFSKEELVFSVLREIPFLIFVVHLQFTGSLADMWRMAAKRTTLGSC